MKKRTFALILALVLVFGAAVGGTIAYLTDKTDEVKNTFTVGNINIELTETDNGIDKDDNVNTNSYKMVPGNTITKDPKATVKANSEDCYLFVKIEESANFDKFMTYAIADGWTAMPGADGVYYRTVSASTDDQSYAVLKENKVSVKNDVTKEMMNALEVEGATLPTLTFTAYACQSANMDLAAAWTAASAVANNG